MIRNPNRLNLPNALSLLRLLGTPALFWLVTLETPLWFAVWFIFLGITDFFDGLLARRYNLASELGAMLDSIADTAFYGSAWVLLFVLFPDYLLPNLQWILITAALFLFVALFTRLRVGKYLFIHTQLNRLTALLVFLVLPASFLADTTWAIRLILLLFIIASLEVIWIIHRYGAIDPDTRSLFSAYLTRSPRPRR